MMKGTVFNVEGLRGKVIGAWHTHRKVHIGKEKGAVCQQKQPEFQMISYSTVVY